MNMITLSGKIKGLTPHNQEVFRIYAQMHDDIRWYKYFAFFWFMMALMSIVVIRYHLWC